jgi:sec-independent protein translocase protein TatA
VTFPGGWELVLVLLVIMVLFGAKRLPDSARALGRSMRILKAETKGMRDDDSADVAGRTPPRQDARHETTVTAEPLPPVQPPAPPPYGQQQPYDPAQAQGQPPPAPGHGSGSAPSGDQAQQPRP